MAADQRVNKQDKPPRVLVYLTEGGIMEHVLEGNVDLEVIDFQNLSQGDVVDELTAEMIRTLKANDPGVLADLDKYRARFECQDCGKGFWDETKLLEIKNLHQRVSPGDPMPAGECPACGALVSVVQRQSWLDDDHLIRQDSVEPIAHVRMQDVVGDYDIPESIPEWAWVANHASFRHRDNEVQSGVWEFLLNLSLDHQNIPLKLMPHITEARRKGIGHLLFHQGT